jgi:protein gp37
MGRTKIEWTDESWNPIRAEKGRHWCTKISPGCKNCYAETLNRRFGGQPYAVGKDKLRLDGEALRQPLHWRRPRMVFVCSMTDLFHEEMDPIDIAAVWRVMRARPRHTFQVLTKRADRMREWVTQWVAQGGEVLRNVILMVSAENQQYADERVPHLLQTPAAVRGLSYEPALGPVTLKLEWFPRLGERRETEGAIYQTVHHGLNWVIVGGESGPGARLCHVDWIRSAIAQCKAGGAACFVKQLGKQPRGWCNALIMRSHRTGDEKLDAVYPAEWVDDDGTAPAVSGRPATDFCHENDEGFWPCKPKLQHPKGGSMSEWPEDLRVREFPVLAQTK